MTSHRPFRTVRAVHTRVAHRKHNTDRRQQESSGQSQLGVCTPVRVAQRRTKFGRRRCRIAGGSVVPCASTGGLLSVRTSRRKPKHSDGCSSRVLLMTDSTDALPLPSCFLDLLRYQLQRYTSIGRVYGTFSRNRRKHHRSLRRLYSSSDTRTIDVCSTP